MSTGVRADYEWFDAFPGMNIRRDRPDAFSVSPEPLASVWNRRAMAVPAILDFERSASIILLGSGTHMTLPEGVERIGFETGKMGPGTHSVRRVMGRLTLILL